jgi:myo-inositol-1(or 4)-monophosphatase
MQFPCFDALTYCQLAEGRLEMVAQCANKIWDIHPIMPIVRASGAIVTTWDNKNPVVEEILLFQIIKLIIKRF